MINRRKYEVVISRAAAAKENSEIRHRMPSIAAFRNVVASGALASYGIDILGIYRRAAEYTDRIHRDEKPADLPVQAPIKYELIINLKTARAMPRRAATAARPGRRGDRMNRRV